MRFKTGYVLGLLALVAGLVWAMVFGLPDNQVHVVFCQVGQGDAALIVYKQVQILIDGGPKDQFGGGASVLKCLQKHMPFYDRTVELVVLSHPQNDHYGGLGEVVKRYHIGSMLANGLGEASQEFEVFRQTVDDHRVKVMSPKLGDLVRVDQLTLKVVWPESWQGSLGVWTGNQEVTAGGSSLDTNTVSIGLELSYNGLTALLGGDLASQEEEQLVVGKVEVLKVGHHGSKNSTSQDLLDKIQPKLAIISVGKNNYGHPAPETLARLENSGVKTLRTDLAGEIEVISAGTGWRYFIRQSDQRQ